MNILKSGSTMRRRSRLRAGLMVTTALTASALMAAPAQAANWIGATADWFDPANWGGGVPTSGDQANINNGGTAQVEADGAVASSVWIGQNAGQSGALEVTGPDVDLTASGGAFVGFSGSGTLDISDGGVVNSGSTTVAATDTASGSVTVDGEGSALNSAGFTVGYDGEGTLDITNGGYVFSTSSTIGGGSTGSGAVTIDGEGSYWQSLYTLYVGYSGEATLGVSNGGAMSSQGAYVGFQSGSLGEVTVDGEDSIWTVDGGLTVGDEGEGRLDITDGGAVENADGIIGNSATGTGIVTVDGEGSTWTNGGNLYIGNYGTATLNITGGGAVSSVNIFAGFRSGSSATIVVDGAGSTWTDPGNLYLGYEGTGSLTVANGAYVSFNGIGAALVDGGAAAINIGAALGDAAVAAGTLSVRTIEFGVGAGRLVFNHTDVDYELASDISGPGTISQIGSGSTVLTGNSSGFAGTTSVQAGALFVNGVLGGSMIVDAARFGGSGTVSNVTLGNGSLIAPGASAGAIGTLSVTGDLTFNAGSIYEVEINPASVANDLIHVSGTAYLNNASVEHIGLSGTYPWYVSRTILTADTGIDGTFGSINSNMAFLIPDLSYDANNVRMTLMRNDIDFTEVTTSSNQQGVAGAASTLGIGNPIYDQIITMTAEEAQAAFEALSGEAYSSEGTSAFNAAQQLRDVLQARLNMLSSGSSVAGMGYAPAAGDALSGDAPAIWGQVFGSWGVNDATATVAKLERRSSGFLGGADKPVGTDSQIGVALGYSHSDFDVSSLRSSSESANYHVAGYASTKLGGVDLGGTLGYSYGKAEAKRIVVVGGLTNNLSADYDTHTVQASVEVGMDMDMTEIVVTPFAGLAGTYARTDSFTETGGPAALAVDASDNLTGVTSLGLRVRREAGHVALNGSAAWRHAFGDVAPASRVAFASAPAASFIVRGAPVAEDTLAVGAHIDLELDEATKLTFGYAGEFASDARDSALRTELRVEF